MPPIRLVSLYWQRQMLINLGQIHSYINWNLTAIPNTSWLPRRYYRDSHGSTSESLFRWSDFLPVYKLWQELSCIVAFLEFLLWGVNWQTFVERRRIDVWTCMTIMPCTGKNGERWHSVSVVNKLSSVFATVSYTASEFRANSHTAPLRLLSDYHHVWRKTV